METTEFARASRPIQRDHVRNAVDVANMKELIGVRGEGMVPGKTVVCNGSTLQAESLSGLGRST